MVHSLQNVVKQESQTTGFRGIFLHMLQETSLITSLLFSKSTTLQDLIEELLGSIVVLIVVMFFSWGFVKVYLLVFIYGNF